MRGARLSVAGVIAAACVVHCSSFGSDIGSASPVDGDTGSMRDSATVDAMPGTDAGPGGSLCASPHALCDDFNRPGSPFDVSRWSTALGDGGALTTPAYATSPALVVAATGGDGYHLQKNIMGPLKSVHCSFRFYLEETASNSNGIPFSVTLAGATTDVAYFRLRPKADSRPASLIEDIVGVPERAFEFFPLGPGSWNKIELEVPVVRLWLNGVEKPTEPPDGGPEKGPFASASLELGLSLNTTDDPGWRAALDDIVCDVVR